MDTMWKNTHKALEDIFQVLTCKKCNKKLRNPYQFLNCGHFACIECIGSATECVICKMPGELSDIYLDSTVKDMILNLNIIAEAVGLPLENNSLYDSATTNSGAGSDKSDVKRTKTKAVTKKVVNETLNTSAGEATTNSGAGSEKSDVKRTKTKAVPKKVVNETLNTSAGESTISKSTAKRSDALPKAINKKNKKGETYLHIACRSNNVDRVKLLLDGGANPNTKDNAGWTPLQEAVSYGFYEVSEMLLEAGASPDLCGCDSRTALHEAVLIDDCDLASLLLQSNANKKVYDNVGKKPRDYCKSKKMSNLFKSLQENEENIANPNETQKNSDIDKTQKILDADKTLNSTFSESKVVLYGSDLSIQSKRLLARYGKKMKVSNSLSQSVSHVIVETDSNNGLTLSLELLLALLYGKCIISSSCLDVLMDSDNVTADDLNLFMIDPPQLEDGPARARANFEKQNPKLFNNCFFYFCIKKNGTINYDGKLLKKDDLSKLIAAGDGVLLTREPRPEDIQGSLSPFHVAHDPKHSLYKCTHYIIYDPENSNSHSSNRIIYNMPKLKTLPLMWLIESILRFKLIDPVDLGLSTE